MNFTFPENKALLNSIIQNYSGEPSHNFNVCLIDILNPKDNIITINNIEYVFTYFDDTPGKNKGWNSIILKLYESQNIDKDDVQYNDPDMVLKILKYKKAAKPEWKKPKEKRFETEISALKDCKRENFPNIIDIYGDGVCKIYSPYKNRYHEYLFYTMEFAEYDLKKFIEKNFKNFSLEEKVGLCLSLSRGLRDLESLGYYHRDIKPDNIFMVDDNWKIGDLGLIGNRNSDFNLDRKGELIGPRGWMSPESMNKYLCEGHDFPFQFNCTINHQSDIFQLGKVFWYIFQHNAPIGSIKQSDFKIRHNRIYPILRTMLNYSLNRRYKRIDEVIKLLRPIEDKLLITAV
ncbi:hypothetical protein ES705_26230 [subsurface metagenome]